MYRIPFIDRFVERNVLNREYGRDDFRLIIVYGRRYIDKIKLS